MKDRARLVVPVAFWVGLAAALLVLWLSGQAGDAWRSLSGARVELLIVIVVIGMALPVIHAWRWRVIMAALGHSLAASTAAGLTVSASLINYATPGFLGAPAKAILANRAEKIPMGRSLVAIALEQGLDFLLLVFSSALVVLYIGPARFSGLLSLGGWLPSPAIGVAFVALAVVILGVIGRERVARVAGRIRGAFAQARDHVSWGAVVGLTLLYWLAQVAVVGVLLWALRLPVDPAMVLALGTLPLLAGQLAPVPGGVGVREATMVALSGVTGVGAASLLGLAVLQRVLLVAALPLSLLAIRVARLSGVSR
ncbi:MAG: flippase-like domain-containing protein [Chloroflexia bacterium]|nr:flippase-like domain-containing protein [Chloroflexia bacterium]